MHTSEFFRHLEEIFTSKELSMIPVSCALEDPTFFHCVHSYVLLLLLPDLPLIDGFFDCSLRKKTIRVRVRVRVRNIP